MKKRIIWTLGVTCLLHLGFILYLTLQPAIAPETELPTNATILSEETSFTGHVGQETANTQTDFVKPLFLISVPLTFTFVYLLLILLLRLARIRSR